MDEYTVLGIGGCIADELIRVSDEFLSTVRGSKGGMELVSHDEIVDIIRRSGADPVTVPGGSAANAIKGLAQLGMPCAMAGKIGNDPEGMRYREGLKAAGITPVLFTSPTPSAVVLCLVTPDGQRTMRTFLGASAELDGSDLTPAIFEGVKLVHIEGYTLDHRGVTERAMELAKDAGALVSFDVASFEIIKRYKERVTAIIKTSVDILFANEDETRTITGIQDEEAACAELGKLCPTVVTLMGKRGCCISSRGMTHRFPAIPVEKPLDTTGAGDLFTSGFLYGYLNNRDLKTCAHYGAMTGNAVVQTLGAQIGDERWRRLRSEIGM